MQGGTYKFSGFSTEYWSEPLNWVRNQIITAVMGYAGGKYEKIIWGSILEVVIRFRQLQWIIPSILKYILRTTKWQWLTC